MNLALLGLVLILPHCQASNSNPKNDDSKSTQFQTIKFYSLPNQNNEVSQSVAYNSVEYYKVFFYKDSNVPLKEIYYSNYQLTFRKVYRYSNLDIPSPILKLITVSNPKKQKIFETIYQNTKPIIDIHYIYDPSNHSLIRKERYQKKLREGWWYYYDSQDQESKIEYYKKDQLQFYRLYKYNSSGQTLSEKAFDSNHKKLYSYQYSINKE